MVAQFEEGGTVTTNHHLTENGVVHRNLALGHHLALRFTLMDKLIYFLGDVIKASLKNMETHIKLDDQVNCCKAAMERKFKKILKKEKNSCINEYYIYQK